MEGGLAREELQFSLRDWLKNEDLFGYGVSPQFLSRFDAVVLLEPLGEEELRRVLLETADSGLRHLRPTSPPGDQARDHARPPAAASRRRRLDNRGSEPAP